MATIAPGGAKSVAENRFFLVMAMAMALTIVAAFSAQFALGRSTFASRALVHVHALVFMGWVGLFVAQNWLAVNGPVKLHRQLGWIGAGWALALVLLGTWLTVDVVRRGTTPFFFQPQHFLIANPLTVLAFAVLTFWAIHMRRRTEWHRRLHLCGMAAIIGPAFGRLLPMPLLMPYAFEISVVAGLAFPVAGAVHDWRAERRVHPAWLWGIAATLAAILAAQQLTNSPAGTAIYRLATAGSPGATVPPLDFPPPPSSLLVTGRSAGADPIRQETRP